jgi:hypothetical protein
MATGDTIFREYRISDAERSDRSAGDRLILMERTEEILEVAPRTIRERIESMPGRLASEHHHRLIIRPHGGPARSDGVLMSIDLLYFCEDCGLQRAVRYDLDHASPVNYGGEHVEFIACPKTRHSFVWEDNTVQRLSSYEDLVTREHSRVWIDFHTWYHCSGCSQRYEFAYSLKGDQISAVQTLPPGTST